LQLNEDELIVTKADGDLFPAASKAVSFTA